MSAECSGINYALRLHQATIEVRPRRFQGSIVTIEVAKIRSIELLRKSVMPPAVTGGIALSLGVIEGLTGIVPPEFHAPAQSLALGVAAICLMVLLIRWFFANLILKPADTHSITVRMVPLAAARNFVMLFQRRARIPQEA